MAEKEKQQAKRLRVVIKEQAAEIRQKLSVRLPGTTGRFSEPEVILEGIKAVALQHEVCFELAVAVEIYYAAEGTGLVEKAVYLVRFTRLLPDDDAFPDCKAEAEAEVKVAGNWLPAVSAEQEGATVLTAECVLSLSYRLMAEEQVEFPQQAGVAPAPATLVNVETVRGHFRRTFDLSLPVDSTLLSENPTDIACGFLNGRAVALCGWIKVEGDLAVAIPQAATQTLQEEKFIFPARYYFDMPAAKPGLEVEVDGAAQIIACRRRPGTQAYFLRGLFELRGTLLQREPLAVADVIPGDLPRHHCPYKLEEVVCSGSSQTLLERDVFFSRPVRAVREPVAARVRNLQYEIIPNKVIVRGVLQKDIFAVDAETSVVFLHEVREPFVHFVDVPKAAPGMRAEVRARVEYVNIETGLDRMTARQVTIIEITVKIRRLLKRDILVQPSLSSQHSGHGFGPPGRVYFARSGDSVWTIARMFGVPLTAIMAVNKLQSPDLISPGQKLLIPS
ncbi:MAG TPA: LysM peptidoglycan-binding domain-containing protein [Firmicutes bacterium]|nr:LysM peptidoglycan-binding domain-containing protein [Bacillota bacterium]